MILPSEFDPALRVFEDPTHPNSQLTWQLGVVFPFETDVFGGDSWPLSRLPPGVLDVNVAQRGGYRFMCKMCSVNNSSYERRHSKMRRADDEYWCS